MPPPDAARRERFERLLTPEVRAALGLFCLKLTKGRDAADDLYADTLLRAYSRFDRFDEAHSFRNWVYAIAKNRFLDTLRRSDRDVYRAGMRLPNDEWVVLAADTVPDPDSGPHESACHAVVVQAVLDAIDAAPEAFRETLRLYLLEERSHEEVALATGTTTATVKSRIHRGRRAVWAILRERGYLPGDGR